MTTVFLHFGMNKTGSTSIQRFLSGLEPTPDVMYADLDGANQSVPLVAAFTSDPRNSFNLVKRDLSGDDAQAERARLRARVDAIVGSGAAEKIIFSAEGVVGLSKPELADLHRSLHAGRNAVQAVGYVRAPSSFIESYFQQNLKKRLVTFDLQGFYPKYRNRFEKFEEVFGTENVRYWLFDPDSFPERCVVQDFCRRVGIDMGGQKVKRMNDSFSRQALGLLYAYRKFGPPQGLGLQALRENGRLVRALQQLKGDKVRLSRALIAPVLERHADDIAWIEQRLGAPFPSDVGRSEAGAIESEADLLDFDEATVRWLAERLGPKYVDKVRPHMNPQTVADWVSQWRVKLTDERKSDAPKASPVEAKPPRAAAVTVLQLVREAMRDADGEVDTAAQDRAVRLVRSVFQKINEKLESAPEGALAIPKLGAFSRSRPAEDEPSLAFVFQPHGQGRAGKHRQAAAADEVGD